MATPPAAQVGRFVWQRALVLQTRRGETLDEGKTANQPKDGERRLKLNSKPAYILLIVMVCMHKY